jgi:hypothetical protein
VVGVFGVSGFEERAHIRATDLSLKLLRKSRNIKGRSSGTSMCRTAIPARPRAKLSPRLCADRLNFVSGKEEIASEMVNTELEILGVQPIICSAKSDIKLQLW